MTATSAQAEQVMDQFSRQAASYSRLTGSMAGSDRQAGFRALIGVNPRDVVLDVCCGPGTLALDLAPHVARVTGLDLTAAMLEQARLVQATRGYDNVDWVEGDVFALPFADGAFSLVTCGAAFHHLLEPRLALSEMVRVCRQGGRIVVRDVSPDPAKSAAYDRIEILRDPSHTHALTPDEMAVLGRGLSIGEPALHGSVTADLSLDAVLATSFPQACTLAEIRGMFLADAETGQDELGFAAKLVDGQICVSYRQTTAIWIKQ
jgi:ubiquinone/menaquinone biosynthesis C-methylase UbiE